jgi:AraC family transcriptional regulator
MLNAIHSSSSVSTYARGFAPGVTVNREGAFGARIAAYFPRDPARPILVSALRKGRLAVTRLRCETGLREPTLPMPSEKAFIVMLQLKDIPIHQLWCNGQSVPVGRYPERGVSILDLEQEPTALLPTAFDFLQFHVTRSALDELADESRARRIETLEWPHGQIDEITSHLGRTFLPALERPEQASRLFLDHAASALIAHFAHSYGGMGTGAAVARGGLAPWQERRAKEMMNDRLEEDVSLDELATECRLSRSHFARAFKKSTGHSPHRWFLLRRVESAKAMLTSSDVPISEIALAAGFADQSHLTKVFCKVVGAPPAAWRRTARW